MTEIVNNEKTTKQIWINSLKISAKILFFVIALFFYIVSVMFFLAPKFDAKIFNFLGLKKAEESCYLQAYEKSGSNADLYNFIIFLQKHDLYEKELYYINVLMDQDDYGKFCEMMDASALKNSEKNMYAYVGDVDSYLKSRKIKCMYALNLENSYKNRSNNIMTYLRNELKSASVYNTTFATYVNLVLNDDSLSKEQKTETFQTLENMYEVYDEKDTALYLAEKEDKLNDAISNEKDITQKIILQKYLIDYLKAEYHFYSFLGVEDDVLDSYSESYNDALDEYDLLIN